MDIINVTKEFNVVPDREQNDLADAIDTDLSGRSNANVRYVIPEGTYLWQSKVGYTGGRNVELIGDGPVEIKIRHPTVAEYAAQETAIEIGGVTDPTRFIKIENITMNIVGNARDLGFIRAHSDDHIEIRNCHVRGTRHRFQDYEGDSGLDKVGSRETFEVNVVHEDGTALVEDCTMPDGGIYESQGNGGLEQEHAHGFTATNSHVGTSTYNRCLARGFVDNGFYMTGATGPITLNQCTSENNGNGNIRIGESGRVSDCTIRTENTTNSTNGMRSTALVLDKGSHVVVENTRVISTKGNVNEMVRVTDIDSAVFRDCYFELDGDKGQIVGLQDSYYDTEIKQVLFDGCTFVDRTPDVGKEYSVDINRKLTAFRNCEFHVASGATGKGCLRVKKGYTTIKNCYFDNDSTNYSITFDDNSDHSQFVGNQSANSGIEFTGTGAGFKMRISGNDMTPNAIASDELASSEVNGNLYTMYPSP